MRRAQDFEGRELQALQQLKVRQMGDSIDLMVDERLHGVLARSALVVAGSVDGQTRDNYVEEARGYAAKAGLDFKTEARLWMDNGRTYK